MTDIAKIVCLCGEEFGSYPQMYEHVREKAELDESLHEIRAIETKTGRQMHQIFEETNGDG